METEPEEIIDSGSTVKLMKSKDIVTDIRDSDKKLSLATNGGEKVVNQECDVPGKQPCRQSESTTFNCEPTDSSTWDICKKQ